jgi:hypothetical protein
MGIGDIKVIFIGVILGIIVLTGGLFIIGNFSASDNTLDNTQVGPANSILINSTAGIYSSVNSLNSSMNKLTNPTSGFFGVFDALISSVTGGLAAIGNTIGFMNVAAYQFAQILHVPTFVIGLIWLIIIVVIVFAIYAAIMRVNE